MSAPRALLAGPGARRAAVEGRAGTVEIVFSQGAYVRLGEDWLLLSEPGAPFGPVSIAVHGLARLKLAPGDPARVSERRLLAGDGVISLERMRTRRTPAVTGAPRGSAEAISLAARAASAALVPVADLLAPGLAALARGSVREAVRSLAGLGPGLTPAGDDLLAGYAASRAVLEGAWLRQPPVEPSTALSSLAADRASPLGLSYLKCAERGELAEAAARLLAALHAGSPAAARAAARRLRRRAWGATSGNAIAWGMIAGLSNEPSRLVSDRWTEIAEVHS